MLLKDSQGRSANLSKNRCRINISIDTLEYERNIQSISQWYAGLYFYSSLPQFVLYISLNRYINESFSNILYVRTVIIFTSM